MLFHNWILEYQVSEVRVITLWVHVDHEFPIKSFRKLHLLSHGILTI